MSAVPVIRDSQIQFPRLFSVIRRLALRFVEVVVQADGFFQQRFESAAEPSRRTAFGLQHLIYRALDMRQAFLLIHILKLFRVVTSAAIRAERALIIVADHFTHFLITMPRTNLVDHLRRAFKDHHLSRFAVHSPTRIVRMNHRLLFRPFAQLLILPSHRALPRAEPERRLSQRTLGDLKSGQAFQHARHFALRDSILVMEDRGGGLRARPQPMRRRSELIGCNFRMAATNLTFATATTANMHAISFDFGLRRGRQFGVGDDLRLRLRQNDSVNKPGSDVRRICSGFGNFRQPVRSAGVIPLPF